MKTCVFYGNGNCPAEVEPVLEELVEDLIENRGVDMFYGDCKGEFSLMVARVLRNLAPVYPHVEHALVETWEEFLDGKDCACNHCVPMIQLMEKMAKGTWKMKRMICLLLALLMVLSLAAC